MFKISPMQICVIFVTSFVGASPAGAHDLHGLVIERTSLSAESQQKLADLDALMRELQKSAATGQLGGHPEAVVSRALRVGSSRVDLQACKLEYSIVSPK